MALAVGVLLGGFSVFVFSAMPTEPIEGRTTSVVGESSTPSEARHVTTETEEWGASPYRPVGVGETKTLDGSLSPTGSSSPARRLPLPLRGPLDVTIVTLLGVCLVGMATAIVVLYRENTRLGERMRRFEQLAKQSDRDWLSNLDAALEGEWEDENRG
jgi:hypothetical protein